jgi:hypothetical protein
VDAEDGRAERRLLWDTPSSSFDPDAVPPSRSKATPGGGHRGSSAAALPGLEGLSQGADAIKGPSGVMYHEVALYLFRPSDFPRSLAISIIESWTFEPFIAFTILVNCFTMAWNSPIDPAGTWKAEFIQVRRISAVT